MADEEVKVKLGDLKLIVMLIAIVVTIFSIAQLYDIKQIIVEGQKSAQNTTGGSQIVPIEPEMIVYNASLITITDPMCADCFDLSNTGTQINQYSSQLGLKIISEKNYERNSTEAKELINKYNITKIPSVIISKEAKSASTFMEGWTNVGTIESDGTLVYRTVAPPYIDLATEKIMGLVSVVYLNDSSCAACYNVSLHRSVLVNRFGAKITNETYLDVGSDSGKNLISAYNITKVPTVIISSDFSAYNIDTFWLQYGSIETDGSYIFRDMNAVSGAYKDLTTNLTVNSTLLKQQLNQTGNTTG